jgi:uncharacterized surface protein with fasciclin (FAS1) repeats
MGDPAQAMRRFETCGYIIPAARKCPQPTKWWITPICPGKARFRPSHDQPCLLHAGFIRGRLHPLTQFARYWLSEGTIERMKPMKVLKTSLIAATAALALSACNAPAGDSAEETIVADETTGGATEPMAAEAPASQNIVALAQGNADLSTLVTAVTAAGLGETLSGPGPFTVFAPTNAAFAKVDKATLDGLLKPESKDKLTGILTYHVVPGNVKAADVAKLIKDGNGKATIKTVAGGNLTASLDGEKVILTDAKGGKATVTATDIAASNGVVHTIDTVVMPG